MQRQPNLASPPCISFIWPLPHSLGLRWWGGVHPPACHSAHGTCSGGLLAVSMGAGEAGAERAGAVERLCNLLGPHGERDLAGSCGPQPQSGALVISFCTTRCAQVCLATASLPAASAPILHRLSRIWPGGNMRGPFWCNVNLFHPFL